MGSKRSCSPRKRVKPSDFPRRRYGRPVAVHTELKVLRLKRETLWFPWRSSVKERRYSPYLREDTESVVKWTSTGYNRAGVRGLSPCVRTTKLVMLSGYDR